jgi:hypothetical protein
MGKHTNYLKDTIKRKVQDGEGTTGQVIQRFRTKLGKSVTYLDHRLEELDEIFKGIKHIQLDREKANLMKHKAFELERMQDLEQLRDQGWKAEDEF